MIYEKLSLKQVKALLSKESYRKFLYSGYRMEVVKGKGYCLNGINYLSPADIDDIEEYFENIPIRNETLLVNGNNYFNEPAFERMCECLEQGLTIKIYIDCIGISASKREEFIYREELKQKYGNELIIDESGFMNTYRLEERR